MVDAEVNTAVHESRDVKARISFVRADEAAVSGFEDGVVLAFGWLGCPRMDQVNASMSGRRRECTLR